MYGSMSGMRSRAILTGIQSEFACQNELVCDLLNSTAKLHEKSEIKRHYVSKPTGKSGGRVDCPDQQCKQGFVSARHEYSMLSLQD